MGTIERKQMRRARRERAIVDKAKELFLQNGYEATTVDQIADALEISKGAIYLHFDGKEELFFRVLREGLEIMYESFRQAVESETVGLAQFGAIGFAYVRFWQDHADYRQLLNEPAIRAKTEEPGPERRAAEEVGRKLFQLNVETIKQGMRDGSMREDVNPMLAAFVISNATRGVLEAMEDGNIRLEDLGIEREDFLRAVFIFLVKPLAGPGHYDSDPADPDLMNKMLQRLEESGTKGSKKKVKKVRTNGADGSAGLAGRADAVRGQRGHI